MFHSKGGEIRLNDISIYTYKFFIESISLYRIQAIIYVHSEINIVFYLYIILFKKFLEVSTFIVIRLFKFLIFQVIINFGLKHICIKTLRHIEFIFIYN